MYVLPYQWNYDVDTGERTAAFVFTALDTECTAEDLTKALAAGHISQEYHDAIAANTYGGDTPPQEQYWLNLT